MIYAKKSTHLRAVLIAAIICLAGGTAALQAMVRNSAGFSPFPVLSFQDSSETAFPGSDGGDSTTAPVPDVQNSAQTPKPDSLESVSLDIYEYWVTDTVESVSFRLHVRNNTDSLVILDRVEPSCGCILTTVQKSLARKGKDAEIYIALMTNRMSDIQPYTVDVFTNANPDTPLRLYIRKAPHKQPNQTQ